MDLPAIAILKRYVDERLSASSGGGSGTSDGPVSILLDDYGVDLWSIISAGGGSVSVDSTDERTKQFWVNVADGASRGLLLMTTTTDGETIHVAVQTIILQEDGLAAQIGAQAVSRNAVLDATLLIRVLLHPTATSGEARSGIEGTVTVEVLT